MTTTRRVFNTAMLASAVAAAVSGERGVEKQLSRPASTRARSNGCRRSTQCRQASTRAREAPAQGVFLQFEGSPFELFQPYPPAGDQPEAIDQLVMGLNDGEAFQTLLGVTGSGKTFTMAHVIQAMQRPTLVLAPNKTLAAQLYGKHQQQEEAKRREVVKLREEQARMLGGQFVSGNCRCSAWIS